MRPGVLALALLAWIPTLAVAQPGPPGPYVVDVRGTTVGLPNDSSFFPAAPADTLIPSRAFGVDVGGHVYPLRLGIARIGVGVNFVRVWSSASTPPTAVTIGIPADAFVPPPDIRGAFMALAPQLSFNFGRAAGWSHLSGGVGLAEIEMRALYTGALEAVRTTGQVRAINVGGGARWFLRSHVALGFDVRFHRLAATSASATVSATPATTVLSASVGLSVR